MSRRLLIVAVLALGGCATAPSATLKKAELPNHQLIATDSRLRVITNSDTSFFSTTGVVDPKTIICTEPSPDVATTIASSFGFGVSVLGQGSGSLSAQQVEGLVQLGERTAAIQLLRDKMYQTCLAYSNGAISGTTYSMIMSRLDDTIITLSLGDNAAGAFGRKLAGVGGEASAKSDASLVSLPGEAAKIEDQAAKLAAANKKVDDASKALDAAKSKGDADTSAQEAALASAKGERDALLELMRSTAKSASEAAGKISQLQAGGGLTGRPEAASALREMQADFLLKDSERDLVFACMVELGLRGDGAADASMSAMLAKLEEVFKNKVNEETGTNFATALLRNRSTALAKFCTEKLSGLIKDQATKAHEYRLRRAELSTQAAIARSGSEVEKIAARNKELTIEGLKLCDSDFKDDAIKRTACHSQFIPIKADAATPKPTPQAAADGKKEAAPKTPAGAGKKTPPKADAKSDAAKGKDKKKDSGKAKSGADKKGDAGKTPK